MDRRSFLSKPLGGNRKLQDETMVAEMSSMMNYAPVTTPRPRSGLGKFSGTFSRAHAAHLLRRTMFGPKKQEITIAKNLGLAGAVNAILAPILPTAPPLYQENETYSGDKQNQPWFFSNNRYNVENRVVNLKGWWVDLMVNQQITIREKMSLFWHNHLVTGVDTVNDARFSYEYIRLLQDNCLGNFKTLVRSVATNAAMLRYLSGDQNTKGSPNENFARELLELFTLGVTKPDGTPNYTEDDVVAAARVLTGWKTDPGKNGLATAPWSVFDPNRHDTGAKAFSSHFGNRVIQRTLPAEYINEIDDLMDMIFQRNEVALFICREIYKWFVYYEIDPWVETNIIIPMANTFRGGGYNIKPVMTLLLNSQHFYDTLTMGTVIKNPADFIIGIVRQFGVSISAANRDKIYQCHQLNQEMARLQMDQLNPPNVAGWSPYYQIPSFHEIWINTATIQDRNRLCERFLKENIHSERNGTYFIQPINKLLFIITVTDGQAQDVNKVIDETVALLFPRPITATQRQRLKDILIPGLPDSEWTMEWVQYLPTSNNKNDAKTKTMELKLTHFLYEVMTMAEFQMS
jgi:uncharacterized protein (DUF1800 family)